MALYRKESRVGNKMRSQRAVDVWLRAVQARCFPNINFNCLSKRLRQAQLSIEKL